MAQTAPYGSWTSPISSDLIVAETIRLSEPLLDGEEIYWSEARPTEGGRVVFVRWSAAAGTCDLTPDPFNARTRVHEYGGAACAVRDGGAWFVNFSDQRIYRLDMNGSPRAMTPAMTPAGDLRFADASIDSAGRWMVCVREDHSGAGEPANTIVAIDLEQGGPGRVLASGCDFYSNPRISADGRRIAWVQWNHPNMPWDDTELCVAELRDGSIGNQQTIAGGVDESVAQPRWSESGDLYFISDRTSWWNLYRWDGAAVDAVCRRDAEFAGPGWVFGLSSYGFAGPQTLLCVHNEGGRANLLKIDTVSGEQTAIATDYSSIQGLQVDRAAAVFIGGSARRPSAVVRLDLATGEFSELRRSSSLDVSSDYLSEPAAIEFPTENGLTAHAYYYAPANADFAAPADERPPVLVRSHGGPTSATHTDFNLSIQYWTSRGYDFFDVNYGGSTVYVREYRNRLRGQWGVIDVDDCINAAKHLIRADLVDPLRTAIDGGSAGGYTTLCALTMRDFFAVGASHYGVSDLAGLASDTHKFESRYLDRLIGPWPETRDLYAARSPINHVDRLACPVIFFQGDEDEVVPPDQAERMVTALREKGLPVEYVLFEGEQHGFRKAENIKQALDGEFAFFARNFGIETN